MQEPERKEEERNIRGHSARMGRRRRAVAVALVLLAACVLFCPVREALERARLDRELAGEDWLRRPLENWQVDRVDAWYVSEAFGLIGPLERSRTRFGYACVREQVLSPDEAPEGPAQPRSVPVPLLAGEDAWSLLGFQSIHGGERLTVQGYPVRWLTGLGSGGVQGEMQARGPAAREKGRFAFVRQASGLGCKGPILLHEATVRRQAGRYGLPVALLLAVMQVESGGRQDLVSAREAVGLMQVQPWTAGADVARYLGAREARADRAGSVSANPQAGQAGQGGTVLPAGTHVSSPAAAPAAALPPPAVSREELLHPETNIAYGACYLHLLFRRHFAAVHDRDARLLCVLAAYNVGPGRFLRLFGRTRAEALAAINAFTTAGLYEEIGLRLGNGKGQAYLDRVITLMLQYRRMGY